MLIQFFTTVFWSALLLFDFILGRRLCLSWTVLTAYFNLFAPLMIDNQHVIDASERYSSTIDSIEESSRHSGLVEFRTSWTLWITSFLPGTALLGHCLFSLLWHLWCRTMCWLFSLVAPRFSVQLFWHTNSSLHHRSPQIRLDEHICIIKIRWHKNRWHISLLCCQRVKDSIAGSESK